MQVLIAALIVSVTAQARDRSSWENVSKLSSGERIEVTKKSREVVKGTFVSVAADSLQLRDGQLDVAVSRSDVSRIRRAKAGHKGMWIGLAVGAGAGAGIGAGAAEATSNASGGDFANLKPAITAVIAAIGAIAGLGIGYWIDSRHQTIYDVK